jgi:hypothetical protein
LAAKDSGVVGKFRVRRRLTPPAKMAEKSRRLAYRIIRISTEDGREV